MEKNNFIPVPSGPVSLRRTPEEMYPLVEQWLESGERQLTFCDSHNLTVSTFSYWVRKYRRQNNVSEAGSSFVPLSIQSPVGREIEIIYPNGVKVRVGLEVGSVFILELAGQC